MTIILDDELLLDNKSESKSWEEVQVGYVTIQLNHERKTVKIKDLLNALACFD